MKNTVTKYWNPVDKVWQTEEETPYLKPYFVSWEEYSRLKNNQ